MVTGLPPDLIRPDLLRLNASPASKEEAIREAAQLLIAAGCIDPAYAAGMLRREAVANTFLGHGVAIPHGMVEDRGMVRRNGIAVLQVPGGVEWNPGQTAHLVVAIAAQSDAHIAVLRRLTRLMQDEARLTALFTATDPAALSAALGEDAPVTAPATPGTDLAERFAWVVDYPTGLHARPATAWVETARASAARIQVRHGDLVADAKALVALLQLGLRAGDSVVVSAEGEDAVAALARMKATITRLTAREKADAAAAQKARAPARGWTPPNPLPAIPGIAASPGLAIGPVHVLPRAVVSVPDEPVPLIEGGDRLHEALSLTRQNLKALADDTARRLGPSEAAIFTAQVEILNDTDLVTLACQLMVEGHGVAWSWHRAVERTAAGLAALDNPVLAARAADLRDVGQRVLARIDPALRTGGAPDLPDTPCILVAEDLSPSDTAALDMARVIGLATAQGGPTSHTAILARTLGLPAMVAGGAALMELANGTPAILDGQTGRLHLSPAEADTADARAWIAREQARRAEEAARRGLPARTRDGHEVEIGANVNRPDQVAVALSQGAESVGLMRTEFLFLERGDAPGEDEQYETYRGMLAALEGRPLIVRALDIGGDKQVPHLQLPQEENPFLGVRGARLLLRKPELLETQLRALYRAAKGGGHLSIMFPMITALGEVQALRAACERIRAELDAPAVPLGIMVEVPAAAIQADVLARHVDFFSIGTNDLTQYALAIDRQHPELAAEADSLHPAVLRLIRMTVEGAERHGRWVGVCGGIAGDPFGAALLTGLGVRELSMTPRDIPAVKDRLRGSDLSALRNAAQRALDCETADAVRALDGGGA
ncbi:phosphoenolpyruvate--protein phosphotransferase [Roseomonas genomospecies 6]|uniref:phosphoenolpyruvate--protein phosphotransferase n=1 Tax=Roseomonas genomospecies 6 TaxID=214106 RepID=A0A9W7NHN0_9PROT|nr:phosphoenolpyruvate--protein phosphotransferase [Roseomonas genomospecies 6]KAA0678969.1 phosphoenolpyruvate--protein phosphotransferase [Roseomonas genomospecies 6]